MSVIRLVMEEGEGKTEEIELDINEIYAARRRTLSVNVSSKLVEILNKLRGTIVLDNGRPIPMGNLIEDFILYVLEDGDRLQGFLDEFYPPLEEDEDDADDY